MRLSNFIQDTLYEIARGVDRARIKAHDLVAINPTTLNGELVIEKSYVEFDVSIVVEETETQSADISGQAGGEIQVASLIKLSASAGGKSDKSNANKSEKTHRVAFKVPVYLNANYRNSPAAALEAAELEQGEHAVKTS